MRTRIARWDDGLALRIPPRLARQAGLAGGTVVQRAVIEGRLVVTPVLSARGLDALLAGVTPGNRHGETDWVTPVGREVW